MYIIAVQALSDRFAHDPSLLNAAAFLGLYLAVYWSWCGEVMYLDRFETNGAPCARPHRSLFAYDVATDLLHRVALFVEVRTTPLTVLWCTLIPVLRRWSALCSWSWR